MSDKEQLEMKEELERQASFAALGRQVLGNEAYKSAFTTRKAHLFNVFCNTAPDQTDVREEAYKSMQNLLSLESYFEEILESGKMSQETLDELEKYKDR
jgi:hypothetical protein